MAQAAGGDFLLRIEDIDQSRARDHWETQIYDDLAWLGLKWQTPVMRQSENIPQYRAALGLLWDRGLVYPCSCTRADIKAASSAPQEGVAPGPDGPVYPGTCRDVAPRTGDLPASALRLDMAKAMARVGQVCFDEYGDGAKRTIRHSADQMIRDIGDPVLARRDMGTSYHLSVVVDDAAQGITDVIRGKDLFEATSIHVILQNLLGYPTPRYHHHRLIRDETGKRLAKRDDARAISLYRAEGASSQDIRSMTGI